MSDQSREQISRVRELYSDGGVREVARGVRDTVFIDYDLPLHRLPYTPTLSAGGESVKFISRTKEPYIRAETQGEKPIQSAFVNAIRPGDVVWDVGANMGSYSLLSAKAGADVVAFEPGPEARGVLVENARLNGVSSSVNSTPYALSDYDGEAMLAPSERTGTREIQPDGDDGDTVPVRRGDGLTVPTPDLAKVDVEGHELHVLRGMRDVLSQLRYVVVEVHPQSGVDPKEVHRLLENAGLQTDESRLTRREIFVRGVRPE